MYILMWPAHGPQAFPGRPDARAERAATRPASAEPPGSPLPDVVVALGADAVNRAGITTAPVAAGGAAAGLRLPGVVAPNPLNQPVAVDLTPARGELTFACGMHMFRGAIVAE